MTRNGPPLPDEPAAKQVLKLNDEKAQKHNGYPTRLFFCPTVGAPGGTVDSLEPTPARVAGMAAVRAPLPDGDRLPRQRSSATADRHRRAFSDSYRDADPSANRDACRR